MELAIYILVEQFSFSLPESEVTMKTALLFLFKLQDS